MLHAAGHTAYVHLFSFHYEQESMYSYVLKGLISISTAFLLALILMYHAREIQVQ